MIEVQNRQLIITGKDRHIGFVGDNESAVRVFRITDRALFDLSFKLDIETGGERDIIDLEKTVGDDCILLTWTVTNMHTQTAGIMHIQLRGIDTDGTQIWHSTAEEYFRIGRSVYDAAGFDEIKPSEFEQLEKKITKAAQSAEAAKTSAAESAKAAEKSGISASQAASMAEYAKQETMIAKDSAQDAVSGAQTSANEALGSKLSAAQSAQSAAESAAKAVTVLDDKVDKEDGKTLSSNDYTDEDKAAVDALGYNTAEYPGDFNFDGYVYAPTVRASNVEVDTALILKGFTNFERIEREDSNGNVVTLQDELDKKADKAYVTSIVGNINTALDGIISAQQTLIGGNAQ